LLCKFYFVFCISTLFAIYSLQKNITNDDGLRADWIEQCFTSPPTQYRLYGRRFLQVKRPNQQYQGNEGTHRTQIMQNIQ